ncbi:MAG: glycosyltransferase family 2 protein, partial [Lachnospiraceae bacterium]|nr:glycosyltransferase family 2 protein [Lachnospiraceae bacterium]
MLISFVVPCYKSAKTIEKVVSDINALVKTRKGYEAEIILVNDKSPDNTWEVITDLVKKNKNIVGIDLAKNSGQQCALMAGFKQAKGEIILASDDDGQTPVDTAYSLIDKLIDENFDVVCAKYVDRGKRSLFRRIGTWADRKMVKVFLEKPDEFTTSIY